MATYPETLADLMDPRFKNFGKNPQIPGELDPKLFVKKLFEIVNQQEDEDVAVDALVHLGLAATTPTTTNTPLKTLIRQAREQATDAGESDEKYLKTLDNIRAELQAHPETINERWEFDVTPLHEVACSGLEKLTELLLSFNPDTTLVNSLGETAEKRCQAMSTFVGEPLAQCLVRNADAIAKH